MFSRKIRDLHSSGMSAYGQIVPDFNGYLTDERREMVDYQGLVRWHYQLIPHHTQGKPGDVENIKDNLYFHIKLKCLDNSESYAHKWCDKYLCGKEVTTTYQLQANATANGTAEGAGAGATAGASQTATQTNVRVGFCNGDA